MQWWCRTPRKAGPKVWSSNYMRGAGRWSCEQEEAVEEWLEMVLRGKLGKRTHVCMHMQWQAYTSTIFLSASVLLRSLAYLSSLPKTAAIPSSNIIMTTLKVSEGVDGHDGKCWVTGCVLCLPWTQHNEIQIWASRNGDDTQLRRDKDVQLPSEPDPELLETGMTPLTYWLTWDHHLFPPAGGSLVVSITALAAALCG